MRKGRADACCSRAAPHHARDLFKIKVPLAAFQGQQLQPGQYQYGFSFVLPPGLPGSFEYVGTGRAYW